LCGAVCCDAGYASQQGGMAIVFYGTSDASAAVVIGKDTFVVADDENNTLRVYKMEDRSLPVFTYELSSFLAVDNEHPEADIEGATRMGKRIYWITSHGRNKDGKVRPSRYRFFATSIETEGDEIKITPVGLPYKRLVHSLLKCSWAGNLGLEKATGLHTTQLKSKELKRLAPKEEGLNIEGLCASPDGRTLYIGFRNPLPREPNARKGQSIVVPVYNAEDIIDKRSEPNFGEPIVWYLDGLGIRSMEYVAYYERYFIVAGPHDEEKRFFLYSWSGENGEEPVKIEQIKTRESNFTPEGLFSFEGRGELWLISDDGSQVVDISSPEECLEGEVIGKNKCLNKHLRNANRKTFRAVSMGPLDLGLDKGGLMDENIREK
jgi:hypothetical protein